MYIILLLYMKLCKYYTKLRRKSRAQNMLQCVLGTSLADHPPPLPTHAGVLARPHSLQLCVIMEYNYIIMKFLEKKILDTNV